MALQTRIVTCEVFYPDGSTPWEGGIVTYRLKQDSYTAEATVPKSTVTATVDAAGHSAAELWCNAEGFRESRWGYTLPDGSSGEFVLPEGSDPISLEFIRQQEDRYDWEPPENEGWDALLELILSLLRNTANTLLGDGLIGTKNSGSGAVATTVHAKLGQFILSSDYDTLEDAAAAALAAERALVINSTIAVDEGTTIPATVGTLALPGCDVVIAEDVTLTINGAFAAGRHQVFSGDGTADLNSAKINGVFPEWWGITVGADNTAAFQKACDAHLTVIGDDWNTQYWLQIDLTQWSPKNFHRIKHPGNDPSRGWANGVWTGPTLRDGAVIKDCSILMTRGTSPVGTGRGVFCFGAGNVYYADPEAPTPELEALRVERVTLHHNRFENFTYGGGSPVTGGERYKVLFTQSVDNVIFTDNHLIGTHERNTIIGAYVFDCKGSAIFNDNYGERVFSGIVLEYATSVTLSRNIWWNSRQFIDCDAHVDRAVVSNNLFDREERDTGTDDAVYEFNGVKNLSMTGNVTVNGHRGCVLNCKPNLYRVWEDVMTQTETAGPANTGMWDNATMTSNVWRNITWQVFLGGSNWNTFPHPEQLIGGPLVIDDVIVDCGWELGSGDEHAIVQIYEGRGLRITPHIENPAQILTTVATAVTDIDPEVFSLEFTSVDGFAVGDKFSLQYDGDTEAPRKNQIMTITDITGSIVTFDNALTWTVDAGNSIRGGSGGGLGVYARAFVEGDGVSELATTIAVAAAEGDEEITVVNGAGYQKYALIDIEMDDPDIDTFQVEIADRDGNTISLAEPLPGAASIGNDVFQHGAEGAGEGSALTGIIGGTYENCGFSAIRVNKPGRILIDRPVIRNCGRHAVPGNRRQVWIQGLQEEYTRDSKPAVVTIDGADIEATIDDIRFGLLVQAGHLPDFSNGWTAGLWVFTLRNSRIVGHNYASEPDLDNFDLHILDAGETEGEVATSNQSLVNFHMANNIIGTTSINTHVDSQIASAAPVWMTGPSYPIEIGAPNARLPRGMVVQNSTPLEERAFGWVATEEGRPGTWEPFGAIGPRLPLTLTIVPRYPTSTSSSPAYNSGAAGNTIRWTGGHATQDLAYISFITPKWAEGARTVKALIVGTATPENIIIKTSRTNGTAAGSTPGFGTSNSEEQSTVSVAGTYVEVTIAAVTLTAGEVCNLGFRPRTPADGAVVETKEFLTAWLE